MTIAAPMLSVKILFGCWIAVPCEEGLTYPPSEWQKNSVQWPPCFKFAICFSFLLTSVNSCKFILTNVYSSWLDYILTYLDSPEHWFFVVASTRSRCTMVLMFFKFLDLPKSWDWNKFLAGAKDNHWRWQKLLGKQTKHPSHGVQSNFLGCQWMLYATSQHPAHFNTVYIIWYYIILYISLQSTSQSRSRCQVTGQKLSRRLCQFWGHKLGLPQ